MSKILKKAAFIAFAAFATSTAVVADDDGYPGNSPKICNKNQNLNSGCTLDCAATPGHYGCSDASPSH